MDRPVPWEKAKDIIRGALSEVEKLSQESSRRVTGRINEGASTSSARPTSSDRSVFEEHKRLFGFKGPGLSSVSRKRYKAHPRAAKKSKVATYTKETICVKFADQTWMPSTEDRMELAKVGLGLKKLLFDADGNAQHIHDVITSNYPVLNTCGGYTLMRLAANSRGLIPIDGPDGGITVPFLKDILRQAKLFVRPLQTDVSIEEAKKLCATKEEVSDSNEC